MIFSTWLHKTGIARISPVGDGVKKEDEEVRVVDHFCASERGRRSSANLIRIMIRIAFQRLARRKKKKRKISVIHYGLLAMNRETGLLWFDRI